MSAKEKSRPLIAVTCGNAAESGGRKENYKESIERVGGDVVFVQPREDVRELSVRFDGFVFPGGRDLDPSLYGESTLSQTVLEEPERTRFEFSLLSEIMRQGKPVLGICYGMQLINVFFGGSLFQDIRSGIPGSLDHAHGYHLIKIRENPYIRPRECNVNSSHHQAVRKIGDGMRPFAEAADGVIEGLYHPEYGLALGVQWHPERMKSSLAAELFKRFIDACQKR